MVAIWVDLSIWIDELLQPYYRVKNSYFNTHDFYCPFFKMWLWHMFNKDM